jgi:hypothetical protein
MKRISGNILFRAISSILDIPSIFVKARFAMFAKSTEYLNFLNKNP